ncbi:hypothetical protein [uncultured Sulfitobacter sp.]|uniref:AbiU2 domain-containing protein n=1 Tax=uncultured Sulfitobacter sp. TaxID=191468 RepID=UPI0026051867|nr:hypothetical protein [uncultured Sulfitobacter sp.]
MELTHDDILENYAELFGVDDGATVKLITDSISQLYKEWNIFLYFFCGPRERVDVLNESSGSTARTLQSMLWDSAVMKVRKLTDPAKSRSNKNLSIENLVRIAFDHSKLDISGSYETTMAEVTDCRKYADKYLVHRDLGHALGKSATSINRKSTTLAIRAIGSFVKTFHMETRDTQYALMPISFAADEQQFLMRLHLGNLKSKELEAERYARAISGEKVEKLEYRLPEWIRDDESRHPLFDLD